MPLKQVIFLLVVFVLLFGWVVIMILKNQLREIYAVIWVLVTLCIPASILLYPLLQRISGFAGFIAPVNFSFAGGFLILFILSLHFSAMNSHLHRSLKNTVQKLAILEEEVRRLREDRKENERGGQKP